MYRPAFLESLFDNPGLFCPQEYPLENGFFRKPLWKAFQTAWSNSSTVILIFSSIRVVSLPSFQPQAGWNHADATRRKPCQRLWEFWIDWDHQRWENEQWRETSSTELCVAEIFGYEPGFNPRTLIKPKPQSKFTHSRSRFGAKVPLGLSDHFWLQNTMLVIEEKLRKIRSRPTWDDRKETQENFVRYYRLIPEISAPGAVQNDTSPPQPSCDATEQYLHEFGQ